MRWAVSELFQDQVIPICRESQIKSIAIVGGYETDPEVTILKQEFQMINVEFYGLDVELPSHRLDINLIAPEVILKQYDLVVCSQVLEHIWNIPNFFDVLDRLTRKDGFIWISCPYSNFVHGSPEFFSAGYTSEFIINNAFGRALRTIYANEFGSKRSYVSTHLYSTWLSRGEHSHPITRYQWNLGSFIGRLRKYLRELPQRIHLSLISPKISERGRWSTETVVLLQKVN